MALACLTLARLPKCLAVGQVERAVHGVQSGDWGCACVCWGSRQRTAEGLSLWWSVDLGVGVMSGASVIPRDSVEDGEDVDHYVL